MPVPFEKLYQKQKTVVTHKHSPLLILAGPGTGKTEVLTHRIAYLVNKKNVHPTEILAITFSRKATNEMADRLSDYDGFEENQPRTSTLHAEAYRILKGMKLGIRYLLNEYEAMLLVMDAAIDVGLNLGFWELRKLKWQMSILKANDKLPNDISCVDEQDTKLKKLYTHYEDLLLFNYAIGLDGLIMKVTRTLSMIDQKSDLKTKHVLVDEYQDINQVEFKFIQILSKDAESLFVVGDDDQSIYGWRGADPSIIRNFHKHFEDAQIEMLEESHRCTGNILNGAQAIVSKDPNYQCKPLKSVKGDGTPIHVLRSKSWSVEAMWIANWIKEAISKGLTKPHNMAILCKTLKLGEFLVEQLRILGIETVFWRRRGLFNDQFVLDVLVHVRLVLDKKDNLALRRCLDTQTGHGIGNRGILKVRRIAEKQSCCFWEVLVNARKYPTLQRWENHFMNFVHKLTQLEDYSLNHELDETIRRIAKELNISERSSINQLREFTKSLPRNIDLEDFLKEVNRNRGLDLAGGVAEPEEEKDAVNILTMHSAKGLTYDIVFILGMEEGIFPDLTKDINEQRRLCYVAMTRARKELFLCYCKALKGQPARGLKFYDPSSFLFDLPDENIEVINNL